jgi:hypothetical protein
MENAVAIASVLGPVWVIVGLSYLLYAKKWQDVARGWTKDHYSLIPMMLIVLILGIIAVRMYNVWEWNVWLLVTLAGWGMLLKGALFILLPGSFFKGMMKAFNKGWVFHLGGLVALVAGGALSYYVYFA